MAVTHPLVLSRQFWPELVRGPPPPAAASGFATAPAQPALPLPLGGAALTMPGQFARTLDAYARAFESVKSTRKLRWLAGRGRVSVRLTMDDGRVVEERDLSALQGAVVEFAAQMSGAVNGEYVFEALYEWSIANSKSLLRSGWRTRTTSRLNGSHRSRSSRTCSVDHATILGSARRTARDGRRL